MVDMVLFWSEAIIGLTHLSIAAFIYMLVHRQNQALKMRVMTIFLWFFIVCGISRLVSAANTLQNLEYVDDIAMISAAVIGVVSAVALWPLMPRIRKLPSPGMLMQEIAAKDRALEAKDQAYAALEAQTKKMIQLEEHDQRQKLLIRELNHRVKNTLTVVQSISRASLRTARDKDHFGETFEERLLALANTHSLLFDVEWQDTSITALTKQLLAPYGKHYRSTGPDLTLSPQAALSLGMAVHELATNAIKHGAWHDADGWVEIETRETAKGVDLIWRESGGPEVFPPIGRSFGSKLLHEGVTRELKASAAKLFLPEGIVYTLSIPPGVGVSVKDGAEFEAQYGGHALSA